MQVIETTETGTGTEATPNDIAHWRAQVFARLLQVVLLLGLLTAIPSVLLAVSERIWSIALVDTLALAWVAAIWRLKRLSYRTRVANFLAAVFLVGVALMLKVGPISQIYMMAVPVLAALLLGLGPALLTLAVTGVAVLAASFSASSPLKLAGMADDAAFLQAAIIALNFTFITAVITLSCAVLLQHLARSLAALQETAASLERGQHALHVLNAEMRLTSAAVARLNDMVLIAENADAQGRAQRIIFVNDAFERRTGYRRDEVLGRDLSLLHGPQTETATVRRIARAVGNAETVRAELINYTKDGQPYWVETELVPLADADGQHTHWVMVERDITERKRSEDDIHRLAFFDVLTGLPNRRLLLDRIDQLLASSERGAGISAVMFIDLDRFKYINDARGHATGDALLKIAAQRLSQLVRKVDTVARIGGDEFVLLLAHLDADIAGASHAALTVAEKIRAAIARQVDIDGQSYQPSASIGITLMPRAGQLAHDLLREADTAMYRAKNAGRSGIAFFEASMQADMERRLSMERDLSAALAAGQMAMHYQAQVDRHGRTIGAELLMRWRRADGGMVSPAIFIPVAEESGMIVQLGQWALRQAAAALLQLRRAGHPIPLSVNVSPTQFRQADFVAQVRTILRESGAPPTLLILEVTEGLLIEKLDDTIARMHELAALGIRFSIDDFGTGYSSLAYLKKMPLYELKIDRSFIQDTPDDANGTAIVQSILAMARHLGLRVVAEGVETQAQADFLIGGQCDSMQGYLYARPAPLAELLARLNAAPPAAIGLSQDTLTAPR